MTRPVTPDDLRHFGQRFSIAMQLAATRFQKLLDAHGLTQVQLNVLMHLSRLPDQAPPPRVGDVAHAVEITQPAATKILNKFDNLGLLRVIDGSDDKRVKRVRITDQGRAKAIEIQKSLGPDMHQWFEDWDQADLQDFTAHLTKLGNWLDQNRLK